VAAGNRWHQGDADWSASLDADWSASLDADWSASPDADRSASPDMGVRLDQLPLATLILAGDGTAVTANQAWAALAARIPEAARGDGWLGLLAPADRGAFATVLRAAAQARQAGSAEVRLASAGPERTSRWWWRPGPAGQLVVCVAELGGLVPRGSDDVLDVLALVVHRLFGIGLKAQSAVGVADMPAADRLQLVVDELDELIRDARSMALARLRTDEPGGLALGRTRRVTGSSQAPLAGACQLAGPGFIRAAARSRGTGQ
jgi:PAS fold